MVGDSDGKRDTDRTAEFHQASIGLRERAIAFVERIYNTGEDALRGAFLDAEVTLRYYLNTLEGGVVTFGDTQTKAIFGNAVEVLCSEKVASVFGLPPAPEEQKKKGWPLKGTFDGNGAYLIEEITRMLQPATTGLVSQHQFIVMQRIADYGPQTITGALNDSPDREEKDPTTERIQIVYRWWTALRDNRVVT